MKVRNGGGKEIPPVQGKEQWLCFAGAAVKRYPMPEVRGGGQEELPKVWGAVAARAQEGQEELLHVQGQEGQPVRRYPSSKVRSSSCGAALKRYPTSKVRETQGRQ